MFSKGYRPKSSEHHIAVISFIKAVYSTKFPSDILETFNKARLRRSESMYDRAGSISENQGKILQTRQRSLLTKQKKFSKFD